MRGRGQLEITCPECGGHSVFREPFRFLSAPGEASAHRWGSWHVVENYPEVMPWQAPAGSSSQYLSLGGPGDGQGYALLHRGVVECRVCSKPFAHTLSWPDDAWWQWSVRGRLLWAWDRQHAREILEFVRAVDRPPRSTSGPIGSLPSHFLSAKVRDTVVKAIERTMAST